MQSHSGYAGTGIIIIYYILLTRLRKYIFLVENQDQGQLTVKGFSNRMLPRF